jgi:hypothetical protein
MAKRSIAFYIKNDPSLLIEWINTSSSLTELLNKLNISPNNTYARKQIKDFANEQNVVLPIFLRKNINTIKHKNNKTLSRDEIMEYFSIDNNKSNALIKNYILKHKLIPYRCSSEGCNVNEIWNNKILNLHLDHKNGNNKDNSFDNLRFLCPNCHTQTDTYTAKNSNAYKDVEITECARCHEISKSGKYCKACIPLVSKLDEIEIPNLESLLHEINNSNINYVANKYQLDRGTLTKIVSNPTAYSKYPKRIRATYPTVTEINTLLEKGYSLSDIATQYNLIPSNFYRYYNKNTK